MSGAGSIRTPSTSRGRIDRRVGIDGRRCRATGEALSLGGGEADATAVAATVGRRRRSGRLTCAKKTEAADGDERDERAAAGGGRRGAAGTQPATRSGSASGRMKADS